MSAAFFLASDTPLREDEGNGFAIYLRDKVIELATEKNFFACLEWGKYSFESASEILAYIKEHLFQANHVELWYTWLDNNIGRSIRKMSISSDNLSVDD